MECLGSLSVIGSALTAECLRADIIMQSFADQSTTRTTEGSPYVGERVVLRENALDSKNELGKAMTKAESGGVYMEEVVESQNPLVLVYDPDHPDADEDEYVMVSNVNSAGEIVDLMAVTRAYEANVTAFNIAKGMALKALEIDK